MTPDRQHGARWPHGLIGHRLNLPTTPYDYSDEPSWSHFFGATLTRQRLPTHCASGLNVLLFGACSTILMHFPSSSCLLPKASTLSHFLAATRSHHNLLDSGRGARWGMLEWISGLSLFEHPRRALEEDAVPAAASACGRAQHLAATGHVAMIDSRGRFARAP